MNDPYPSSKPAYLKQADRPRSLLERLSDLISPEPDTRAELLEVLQEAHERSLIDADSLSMIEGVFQVSELTAADIMVPRAQMDMVNIADAPETFIPFMQQTAHSRFPVYEGSRDNIIGILLAKDLLRYYTDPAFDLRETLRPAVFIPESKRLNILLREFRINRNHIAMVVDEYGGVAGLVTIEDVLEQIVGDIEDEFDLDEDQDNILPMPDGSWRVHGLTEIAQFNEAFGTGFSDHDVDTVGGLLSNHVGHVPHRGEIITLPPIRFEVLRADARQVHLLQVHREANADSASAASA